MNKKFTGIDLLKHNFSLVESKYVDFFEKGQPRWSSEKHDFLRNHHQSLDHFFPASISWDKLRLNGLPDYIVEELHAAYDSFERGQEYL
jgi:hypothetical protein